MVRLPPTDLRASTSPRLEVDSDEDLYDTDFSDILVRPSKHGLVMGLDDPHARSKSGQRRPTMPNICKTRPGSTARVDGPARLAEGPARLGPVRLARTPRRKSSATGEIGKRASSPTRNVPVPPMKARDSVLGAKESVNNQRTLKQSRHMSHDKECVLTEEEKIHSQHNVTSLFGSRPKMEGTPITADAPKDESPWRQFEDYILTIDLDTLHFQPKPFAETSSDPFKSVMGEMQSDLTNKRNRHAGFKNALRMGIKFQGFKKNMEELKEVVKKQEAAEAKKKTKNAKKARPGPKSRGWKIIQNFVQELRLEKKKTRDMGGWNFLTRTMKQLTHAEKARQELYDRYLNKPNAWTEGFSTFPQVLLDRMRQNQENSSIRSQNSTHLYDQRPHTAAPHIHRHRDSGSTSEFSRSDRGQQLRDTSPISRSHSSMSTRLREGNRSRGGGKRPRSGFAY